MVGFLLLSGLGLRFRDGFGVGGEAGNDLLTPPPC
jgi:hypothetical protein